ncbi:MAG: pyridoxal-dependent decarboxylase [Alphaproteobacteria bacterium]
MDEMAKDDIDWSGGRTPLYVFHATDDAYEIGKRGFMKFFSENALGGKRAFFGLKQMEDELIDFGLSLFNAPEGAGGILSTGGSESIILAVKAARDFARGKHPQDKPHNIVTAYSAHPAFNKAGGLMDIEIRRAKMRPDQRADCAAMEALIDEQTIMLVGSAPCFPHGVVDAIVELSALSMRRDIWLHVDACVGGYIIPFLQAAGRSVPAFDFNHSGVRSISADLHKFGFCPKPVSTLFLRHADDLERVTFKFEDWPNGLFTTATLAGTRSGGAVAGSWAVLNHLGVSGYTAIAKRLGEMTDKYVRGIEAIDGLYMLARPDATIINFGARELDIFSVAEQFSEHGWLPGLTKNPKGMHAMMSMLHKPVREQYLEDLEAAVNQVRGDNKNASELEAVY